MFSNQIPGNQLAETVVKMLEPFSHQVQEKPEAAAHVQAESQALAFQAVEMTLMGLHCTHRFTVERSLCRQTCSLRVVWEGLQVLQLLFVLFCSRDSRGSRLSWRSEAALGLVCSFSPRGYKLHTPLLQVTVTCWWQERHRVHLGSCISQALALLLTGRGSLTMRSCSSGQDVFSCWSCRKVQE